MTLNQAKLLNHGAVIHHNDYKNRDGSCQRWRVNGKVKTWKRDSSRVEVPIKYGLKIQSYLTELNVDEFHLGADCLKDEWPKHRDPINNG